MEILSLNGFTQIRASGSIGKSRDIVGFTRFRVWGPMLVSPYLEVPTMSQDGDPSTP